jgi:hypothetical protein
MNLARFYHVPVRDQVITTFDAGHDEQKTLPDEQRQPPHAVIIAYVDVVSARRRDADH